MLVFNYSKLLKKLPKLPQYYQDLSTSDIFYELSDYIGDLFYIRATRLF